MKQTLLIVFLSALLSAAPAFERERTFSQPDGTTFKGKVKGDEYLNWVETENGDIVLFNAKSKRFEFADINGSALKSSGRPYRADAPRARHTDLNASALERLRSQRYNAEMLRRGSVR